MLVVLLAVYWAESKAVLKVPKMVDSMVDMSVESKVVLLVAW